MKVLLGQEDQQLEGRLELLKLGMQLSSDELSNAFLENCGIVSSSLSNLGA